jgi:23S rRNA U2552 (ribose-2'-O)-methylase RlmE/FtsJ
MSYYILPKNNSIINVNPIDSRDEVLKPYISHSLYNYYNQTRKEIEKICSTENDTSNNCFNELIKVVNPYEYIFSKVPGSKFSVSKLKPKSNVFYDFLEVSTTVNIFESFKNQSAVKTLHFTPNYNDTIECFEMMRENFNDEIIYYDEITEDNMKQIENNKFNFLFVEVESSNFKKYITNLIECLMLIFKNQESGGSFVIKLNHIFHKPVVDILYILSSLYEKVYILKPNTSNITSFDKYIVCKNFQKNESKTLYYKCNYYRLIVFLKKLEDKNIVSILDFDIPNYFLMKMDDMNIIIGQQQLESLDMVINILKNKNREDKIETIKKSNIQKSVAWCEKYKIPCNRFSEKINIFLPINKEEKESIEFIDI